MNDLNLLKNKGNDLVPLLVAIVKINAGIDKLLHNDKEAVAFKGQ